MKKSFPCTYQREIGGLRAVKDNKQEESGEIHRNALKQGRNKRNI